MIDIETTEAFLKVFEYLSEKFGIVVDTTSKDILPYLQSLGDKIVNYEKSIALMWIVIGAILAVFGLICFFIGCAKDWECMHWIMLIVCVVGGAWIIIHNMYTYIGCLTFEEKVILDYIDNLMTTINNSSQTYR